MARILLYVFLTFLVNLSLCQQQPTIGVTYSSGQFDFDVLINGSPWFSHHRDKESRVFLTKDGQTFSTHDNSLKVDQMIESIGRDNCGVYASTATSWSPSDLGFGTVIRTYLDRPILVFSQTYSLQLNGTSNGPNYNTVSTSFPSLVPNIGNGGGKKGFVSFGGFMAGWTAVSVAEVTQSMSTLRDGELGGPVAFFNQDASVVVVVSPLTHFMVSNLAVRQTGSRAAVLDFGVMSSVESIPVSEVELIMVADNTFDKAFELWGQTMRKYHGKDYLTEKHRDVARNYLGYWTDNGAYYYYQTLGQNVTYEETLFELKRHFDKELLPIQYMNIDSWWYHKGPSFGVTNWTALPEVFPGGLDYVQQITGWPFVAHNRYWSNQNVYAKQNGGDYNFFIEETQDGDTGIALPSEAKFWQHLFGEAKKWGLEVYEQDWLDIQYLRMSVTHTSFTAARNWLLQMGQGADLHDISIQYCMALPRHILQSVEIESVTSARVSGDYMLSQDNWRIGLPSLMSSYLGLATFKNVFWSSQENPDHQFYYDCMIVSNQTDPNSPWTLSYRYNGYQNVTKSGQTCVAWSDLDLHYTMPDNDLEKNACRNPKTYLWGNGKPFCITWGSLNIPQEDWQWEECDIPVCGTDCKRGHYQEEIDQSLPDCQQIREPNPAMHAAISALSRGGVGPGDQINRLDHDVIMATCRQDGNLLMPDLPLRAAPIQLIQMAFSGRHKPTSPHSYNLGEIWHTRTVINDMTFLTLFMAETQDMGTVSWPDLGLAYVPQGSDYAAYYHNNYTGIVRMISNTKIHVPDLASNEFKILNIVPVLFDLVAILGETDKYVPISNNRIDNFIWNTADSSVTVYISGSLGESVNFKVALFDGPALEKLLDCPCVLGPSGKAKIVVHDNMCYCQYE